MTWSAFTRRTIKVGRTSITIKVEVDATRVENQETVRVTEAEIVYVAVDENWKPVPVAKPAG